MKKTPMQKPLLLLCRKVSGEEKSFLTMPVQLALAFRHYGIDQDPKEVEARLFKKIQVWLDSS
jgi:hypothetical protein